MGLALVVGPAKAGKIARLLDGYLGELERDPVLIVPNRGDIDRIERDLLRRTGALLAGSIGTFDEVFRELALGSADLRPVTSDAQRALVARARAGADAAQRARPVGSLRRLRGRAARGALGARVRPAGAGATRGRSGAALCLLPRGARPGRALGPRSAAAPRGRAAAVGSRRLGRPAGLRLRLRGPDGRRVGAARGALGPDRGDGLAAVRAGARGLRVAPPHAGGSRLARRRPDRGAPGPRRGVRPRRARPPRAPSLRRHAARRAAARGSDPVLRGRRRARLARADRGGDPGARRLGHAARGDRARRPVRRALAGVARDRARRRSGSRSRSKAASGSARPRSGRRCWRCCASNGSRVAAATSTRYLRSPFSGLHALERRLPRGQAPRPRRLHARERGGGDDQASRRAAAAAARGAPRRDGARGGRAWRGRGDAARRARPRGAAGRRREPRRPARLRRDRAGCSTSWTAGRRSAASSPRTRCWPRSSMPRSGSAPPASPAGWPSSTSRAPAPAASTPSSCSASRRERCRGAATPRRSSTTTCAASSTGRSPSRLVRPDPVERERYLFYTACTRATRRLTLVREAATDEGSPREPSPFWDEVVALFEPEDVRRWTRRRPLSQLTWELEAAPTERERLRALALLAVTRARGRRGARGRERLGAPAHARPPRRSRGRRR